MDVPEVTVDCNEIVKKALTKQESLFQY